MHWLHYAIIGLILALVLFLSLLHLSSALFDKYHQQIEQLISQIIDHKISIGKIIIGSRGLEPVFKLQQVVIHSKNSEVPLLRSDELYVGIDIIGSLITWQLKSDFLLICGSNIVLYQDAGGLITTEPSSVNLLPSERGQEVFQETLLWLFSQGRVELDQINLKLTLNNKDEINLHNMYLQLRNNSSNHYLVFGGKLVNADSHASLFKGKIKLRGDLLGKIAGWQLSGDLVLENWQYDFNRSWSLSTGGVFSLPSANLNLLIKNSVIKQQLFRQPLFVNELAMQINALKNQAGALLEINRLKYVDPWLQIIGRGKINFKDFSSAPTVDFKSKFKLHNLNKAKLYYPASLMPVNGLNWLDHAFVTSKKITGDFILEGDLNKFPFDNHEGRFLVDSKIRDVELNYDKEWEKVTNITGKMIFSNRTMDIYTEQARILGSRVRFVRAIIPDLATPILNITGEIDTDSALGLDFVNASPLKNTVGKNLKNTTLFGRMLLKLKFIMPLASSLVGEKTQVDGLINLENNTLVSKSWKVKVNALNGIMKFSADALKSDNLSGNIFNYPATVTVDTVDAGKKGVFTKISINSKIPVQNLSQLLFVDLSSYLAGVIPYTLVINLSNSLLHHTISMKSNLLGTEVKLPEPWLKNSEKTANLALNADFDDQGLFKIYADYEHKLLAALEVKLNPINQQSKLIKGEVGLNVDKVKLPVANGLSIVGKIDSLDWSIWKGALFRGDGSDVGIPNISNLSLKFTTLKLYDNVLKDLKLGGGLRNADAGMELTFLNRDVNGKLIISPQKRIKGIFKKLHLNKLDGQGVVNPKKLLPLNLDINNLHYDNKKFKQLVFISDSVANGLKINTLKLVDQGFTVDARGDWLEINGTQQTAIKGRFFTGNVGKLLERWQISKSVVGGSGSLDFSLRWPGPLYHLEPKNFGGNFFLNLKNGRIINLDRQTETKLGLSRVLGVLSLQSLPKRLSLDFSDITKQGFVFDSVRGEFTLNDGNIMVKKLGLEGPGASVNAVGRIGVKAEDYDLTLSVSPNLTSSIPVAAAIAGGPVVGVIGFLADKMITAAMKRKGGYSYHVTGVWAKPNIEKNPNPAN